MRLFIVLVLATMLAALSFTDDAEARRRGFSFGSSRAKTRSVPVIIPISSGSSSVVFVKELPNVATFRFKDKGFYDLAYKFDTFGGGEWVGYFKGKSSYVKLDQAKVKQLVLPMVGLTEADAPTRGAGGQLMVGFVWIIAALVAAVFALLRFSGLRRAIFAPRGRKQTEDDFDDRRFAVSAPAPSFQQKPNLAVVPRAQSAAPSFNRAVPAGAFGKRR